MSVQNPERVVTKQDLKDFYDGIFPYLGGMPEILANKFSKGDMYSTSEKIVGQWIDGKPVYQKTIQLTKATSANTWYTTPIGASVDTVVSLKGFCTDNAHYWGFENPMYGDATLPSFYAQNNNETTANIIAFYSTSNAWVGRTSYYATIQYTKTTDSAVSIGSDTDYSTTEKIVGTWIDGKPLYQRTFNIASNSYITNANSRSNSIIADLSSSNIDYLIIKNAVYHATNGNYEYFPYSYIDSNGDLQRIMWLDWVDNTSQVFVWIANFTNAQMTSTCGISFTVQYTKTS